MLKRSDSGGEMDIATSDSKAEVGAVGTSDLARDPQRITPMCLDHSLWSQKRR